MKVIPTAKKVLYPAMLTMLCGIMCTLFSCNKDDDGPSPAELILGTWTIGNTEMDLQFGDKSLVLYLVEELGLSQSEAMVFDSMLESTLLEFFQGTIQFKSDKTYVINIGEETDTGTYSLSGDGKTLIMDAGTDDETEATILTLDSSTFIIEMTQHEEVDLDGDGMTELLTMKINMTLNK